MTQLLLHRKRRPSVDSGKAARKKKEGGKESDVIISLGEEGEDEEDLR